MVKPFLPTGQQNRMKKPWPEEKEFLKITNRILGKSNIQDHTKVQDVMHDAALILFIQTIRNEFASRSTFPIEVTEQTTFRDFYKQLSGR